MKKHLHVIQSIVPGSIAEEMELQPGDTVLAINGQDIEDVFDYHYLVNDEYIEMLIRTADVAGGLGALHGLDGVIHIFERRLADAAALGDGYGVLRGADAILHDGFHIALTDKRLRRRILQRAEIADGQRQRDHHDQRGDSRALRQGGKAFRRFRLLFLWLLLTVLRLLRRGLGGIGGHNQTPLSALGSARRIFCCSASEASISDSSASRASAVCWARVWSLPSAASA